MNDCIVEYYDSFKDKLRMQNKLKSEMIKMFGIDKDAKKKYRIITLDNCVLAEFKSQLIYH